MVCKWDDSVPGEGRLLDVVHELGGVLLPGMSRLTQSVRVPRCLLLIETARRVPTTCKGVVQRAMLTLGNCSTRPVRGYNFMVRERCP